MIDDARQIYGTCPECGIPIPVNNSKYCSMACRRRATQVERACEACGRTFSVPRSRARDRKGKFCSTECFEKRAAVRLEGRFWSKVDRSGGESACWPWIAGRDKDGYGKFRLGRHGKHSGRAHRLAYELVKGPVGDGMEVCHSCDNPPCCNPAHLFPGTTMDNSLDKISKGRQAQILGLVANETVAMIRERFSEGGITIQALARDFSLPFATVSNFVRGTSRKYAGGPVDRRDHRLKEGVRP